MTTKVFTYKSGQKTARSGILTVLETAEKNGIQHTWSGYVDSIDDEATFVWKFDWSVLKNQGANRLVGQLIVHSSDSRWKSHRVDIDWTDTKRTFSATVGNSAQSYAVTFEYNLTAHYAESPPPEKIQFDEEMFAASDKTDVVLIVEGKKLNVSKAFLSFHSDYFSSLFSANFKEGQMKEIEIKEVSYEVFALLLATFYPSPVFPNDDTVEKLLEMASRFQVLSVIVIVEHHLLHISKIEYEKILWLADEYGMPKLLENCINQMDSLEKAKKMKKSSEFEKLSHKTRSLILGRLLEEI
ncbi:hypothetical protein B9Z55_007661 [Caenorhabditis nigoni]|uniref:BTB domain-containing protein n=1 Tax=Caenorhabditis nigoni TaxID=1611254 RepID=A0A2G5VAM3_9PELO|nr:hypothetical protein B9Z55_007661 [Caenorhabditis nigoni]